MRVYELFSIFSPEAEIGIAKVKKNQPVYYKKLQTIFNELVDHPRFGTGHPHPLKNGGGITWGRHYSKKDVVVYDIYDDIVEVDVLQVGDHYDDK